jgi:hypothetical protein
MKPGHIPWHAPACQPLTCELVSMTRKGSSIGMVRLLTYFTVPICAGKPAGVRPADVPRALQGDDPLVPKPGLQVHKG